MEGFDHSLIHRTPDFKTLSDSKWFQVTSTDFKLKLTSADFNWLSTWTYFS